MEDNITIGKITEQIQEASTSFEMSNTEFKRKYLIWNIEAFNTIAKNVSTSRGSFGTGYPFYVLDENLCGELPIITEQIRYNRQLVQDGRMIRTRIYDCKSCIRENYAHMPDLKKICSPCPNMLDSLKPRKLINRLPDIDMWLICEDECVRQTEGELSILLEKYNMHSSDESPIKTIEDMSNIAEIIKRGEMPLIFLPIDAHIIEYSELKKLIEQVPVVLRESIDTDKLPYLPINPRSYRKVWQYDDEAYNFVFDFLASFYSFNFPDELQVALDNSRKEVITQYTPEQLYDFLLKIASESSVRRFSEPKLEEAFKDRVKKWDNLDCKTYQNDEVYQGDEEKGELL